MVGKAVEERYTYRVAWSESRMAFVVTCDELDLGKRYYGNDPDYLLFLARTVAGGRVTDIEDGGTMPPNPLHPGSCLKTAARSIDRALSDCLAHVDPRDCEPTEVLRLTDRERGVLSDRLDWRQFEFDDMSDVETFNAARNAYLLAGNVLITRSAADRGAGLADGAIAVDRARFAVGDSFLQVGTNDRRKMLSCASAYLRTAVRYLNGPDADSEPLEGDRPILPPDYEGIDSAKAFSKLMERHPWAGALRGMNSGWGVRFGREMMEDMQRVVDLGLRGFELRVVKEGEGGGMDVAYEVADGGPAQRDLAMLMQWIVMGYEELSEHTCVGCGSQRMVRRNMVAGRLLPWCRVCVHAALSMGVPKRAWRRCMLPCSNGPLNRWTDWRRSALMDDPRLKGAHIRSLIGRCQAEDAM